MGLGMDLEAVRETTAGVSMNPYPQSKNHHRPVDENTADAVKP